MRGRSGLAVVGLALVASVLVQTAPAVSARPVDEMRVAEDDWELVLVPGEEGGQLSSPQGLFDEDPTELVPKTPFVQRYTLDQDNWEVWLCGAVTTTMPDVIAHLEAASVDYFAALSGGRYEPVFNAGGVIPDDEECIGGFLNDRYHTVGAAEGLMIVNTLKGNGGSAWPGQACVDDNPDCPLIGSTFPENNRYIQLGETAVLNSLYVVDHELGHALHWPHSSSGGASNYDNPMDVMSGSYVPLHSMPQATLSYNRLQAGWVEPSDVVVADGTLQTVTLEPFNVDGTQLLAVPTDLAGLFYVFGARTTSTYDPIPAASQGVEVYEVDHYCSHSAFNGGICPGILRSQTQEPPSPYDVGHVLQTGESVRVGGVTVTVTAATATGYTVTAEATPDTVPEAPGTPNTNAGDQEVIISWIPPADGGSAIVGFDTELEDRDTGSSTITNLPMTWSTMAGGLTNGGTYRVRVRAVNAVGAGAWSPWSADFSPATTPSRPIPPTASVSDETATLSWTAPADGGRPITNYHLQIENLDGGGVSASTVGVTLATTVNGLDNGTRYKARVRASNVLGDGNWSNWSQEFIPAAVPAAPGAPEVTGGDSSIVTAWTAPADDGGAPISNYEMQVNDITDSVDSLLDLGTAMTTTVVDLHNGHSYRLRVRAENSFGTGPWSSWSVAETPLGVPSAPLSPSVTVAAWGEAAASWLPPTETGGTIIHGYELELENVSDGGPVASAATAIASYAYTGLDGEASYRYRVRAFNNAGRGPWSAWSSDFVPAVVPPAPAVPLLLSMDPGEVIAGWSEPADVGAPIASYDLEIQDLNTGHVRALAVDAAERSYVFTGLMAGHEYRARVRARNAVGDGPWSLWSLSATPDPEPNRFTDDDESVFVADIEWLAAAGVTLGCNPPANDMFCAEAPVSRGQMAAFLARALGLEERLTDPFWDDDGSVFEANIEKLAAAGITRGCNPPANDKFCPGDPVTRGQMAAFLVRALGYTDPGEGDLFVDDNESMFEDAIDRLATAGITRGCNPPLNDMFCPDDVVTRGQMAAFLHRALDG